MSGLKAPNGSNRSKEKYVITEISVSNDSIPLLNFVNIKKLIGVIVPIHAVDCNGDD